VTMAIVISMGIIPLVGWELSVMAILVPVMMIAIANNYGVHIISRYQEMNADNYHWGMKKIVAEVMRNLKNPIILTGLTTIIGILGLVVHILLPAKQMGLVSALGIGFALVLSLTFVPAVLMGMRKGKLHPGTTRTQKLLIDRFLLWAGRSVVRKPLVIMAVFAMFLVICGIGIRRLQVNINTEIMLPRMHPLRISTQIAHEQFGGTRYVTLLFEGDILDPEVLHNIDHYGSELKKMPEIGSVISLASVIRIISKALTDAGDDYYDRIPDTREAIAQYIEFYNMSGNPEDIEKLVNFEYTMATMSVQFRARDIKTFNSLIHRIDSLVAGDPCFVAKSGYSLVEKEMSVFVTRGQVYSLIFALASILLLLSLIFRSFAAGIMGTIPLFFTLVCNFGLMGWLGLELDIANSLLSSVAIGLGVDYTIHLFWRLRSELSYSDNFPGALAITLRTTGRGIAINAFSVMLGFAVLFFSALVLLKTFAFLIIFSLLLCVLCALLLIPAICIVIRPEFLINPAKKNTSFKIIKT
jgi:hypothetical protein